MNNTDFKQKAAITFARINLDGFYNAIWAYKKSPVSPDNNSAIMLKQAYLELIKLEYDRITDELAHVLEWGQLHPSIWNREREDGEDN